MSAHKLFQFDDNNEKKFVKGVKLVLIQIFPSPRLVTKLYVTCSPSAAVSLIVF